MKRIFALSLFVSAFAFALPAWAAPARSVQPSVAAEKAASVPAAMIKETEASVAEEYILPYPGILPDHPLYILKKLRDRIMEKLIADPVRKMEFYTLQADKYIQMGVFLAAKNNESLVVPTMTSGEGFMQTAVDKATSLKQEGRDVPPYIVEKFTKALIKHNAVVSDLMSQTTEEKKTQFDGIQNQIRILQEEVAKLKS